MSSAENDTRLVPMTRKERDNLYKLGQVVIALNWDAAPADPAEAIEAAMLENARKSSDFRSNRGFALAVLAALGMPKS